MQSQDWNASGAVWEWLTAWAQAWDRCGGDRTFPANHHQAQLEHLPVLYPAPRPRHCGKQVEERTVINHYSLQNGGTKPRGEQHESPTSILEDKSLFSRHVSVIIIPEVARV